MKEYSELANELVTLRAAMILAERDHEALLERIPEPRVGSGRNLLHYVALRQHDLRPLQERLVSQGLSSLGRCEAHVLDNVNAVLRILRRLLPDFVPAEGAIESAVSFEEGRRRILDSTAAIFGQRPAMWGVHIMVTMPSEAADDPELVRDLLVQGMDCMRINCAHDSEREWLRMIVNLREATRELNRSCRILMDLGGPKLRTGPIVPGPRVVKVRPHRDSLGRIVSPARVWLAPVEHHDPTEIAPPPIPADAVLPLEGDNWGQLAPGATLQFTDARGRQRELRVAERLRQGLWAEAERTAYLLPGTRLTLRDDVGAPEAWVAQVGDLPPQAERITVYRGDRLLLTSDEQLGMPARYDSEGRLVCPARIGCTLPQVLRDLLRGERVLFDDGRVSGRVEECGGTHVVVEITSPHSRGASLGSDKGINFPDSQLSLDALTDKDLRDLEFIVRHADLVGYSFVRRPEDIERLQSELRRLGRPDLGILLKIENRQAFERLPSLLLTVMRGPASGVMIARGDLAVELGWQRMAEVQEEILWMCEAAHLPVVWATQVLETLAKHGLPSRAEITDAAMGVRAECVMLNKGPYIVEAVQVLGDILRRMQDHQLKKRPLLRRLRLADDLAVSGPAAAHLRVCPNESSSCPEEMSLDADRVASPSE